MPASMHARARAARANTCLVLLMVVLGACGGHSSREPGAGRRSPSTLPATVAPTTSTAGDACASPPVALTGPTGPSVFIAGLDTPTALAWAPDGRLFVAERGGAIKIVSGGSISPLVTLPTVTTEVGGGYSERGLLGLVLSPQFASDHLVYAFYSRQDRQTQVVVRFRECRGAADPPTVLLTFPSGPTCCHKGGRLAFGPDGMLYVSLGEEQAVTPRTVGTDNSVPQDPADVRGKILRYEPDGTIPPDNPFGTTSAAWVTGLRNVFGFAFNPSGELFVVDNGPTGDLGGPASGYDLAFVARRGGRYQWPACYGYGHRMPGASSCLGRPEPDWSSESATIVPTGATWVDGAGPAPLANHFVFCSAYDGMKVFVPANPRASVVAGPSQCLYDVVQGPDHALYFSDDEAVYRLA